MKILFIAPIPPPINGQSLASSLIYFKLKDLHNVFLVNISKLKREANLFDNFARGLSVISFFKQILKQKKNTDLIYLTLSESYGGNLKDIIIYILCYRHLDKMVVHMLGGAGIKKILDKENTISKLNKYFLKKIRGVIVEGNIQAKTFSSCVLLKKIHIVTNFAEDYLFASESEVLIKFSELTPINILFLSNLINGKGYNELADAYIALDDKSKNKIKLNFVGGFHTRYDQEVFFDKIRNHTGINYLGEFINGNEKKKLYLENHIFCLPTYYPFEGQPISILEAYSTGCFVITTGHSGIPQIFSDKINGIKVETQSVESIKAAIEYIVNNKNKLVEVALYNLLISKKLYKKDFFIKSILKILLT